MAPVWDVVTSIAAGVGFTSPIWGAFVYGRGVENAKARAELKIDAFWRPLREQRDDLQGRVWALEAEIRSLKATIATANERAVIIAAALDDRYVRISDASMAPACAGGAYTVSGGGGGFGGSASVDPPKPKPFTIRVQPE